MTDLSTPIVPASAPPDIFPASFTTPIKCKRSGIVLGELSIFLSEGHVPFLQAHNEAIYLSPFYGMERTVLLSKFRAGLKSLHDQGYVVSQASQTRLKLLFSALGFKLNCWNQDVPGLPDFKHVVASGQRLLHLCNWYWLETSQRIPLPELHLSHKNGNAAGENIRFWLDACFAVKEDYENQVRVMAREEFQAATREALREIKSEHILKRLDMRKVWNWIAEQLDGEYAKGRIETFRLIFMEGDLKPEDWSSDDVEDLMEAVCTHCDIGNEIMYFINQRLHGIQRFIKDFWESFTIVGRNNAKLVSDMHGGEVEQTEKEKALLQEYADRAAALVELPARPQRKDFANLGLFMRAEAQWSLLKSQWDKRGDGAVGVAK